MSQEHRLDFKAIFNQFSEHHLLKLFSKFIIFYKK